MKIFEVYTVNGEFELPFYEFKHGDKIAITKIIVDWKTAPNKVFGIITTDLVSGFSENRKQQVCSFVKPLQSSDILWSKKTISARYQIRDRINVWG